MSFFFEKVNDILLAPAFSELEIKLLSEKIDHLLVHQNKKLLEIQEMQIQYLENIEQQVLQAKNKTKKSNDNFENLE